MANLFTKIFKFAANPKDTSLFFFDPASKLKTTTNAANKNFRLVLEDEEIASAFDTRLDSLIATPWTLSGGDDDENLFLFEQVKKNIYSIINYAWWAIPFGKSVIQVVYDKPKGTKVVTISSVYDEDPKQFQLIRNIWTKNKKEFPEGKYFVTVNKPNSYYPEGFPLASRLVDIYEIRCNGWDFFMKYLEKFGVPFFAISPGESTSDADISAMKTFLEAERPRGVILPNGTSINTVDGRTSSVGVFETFDEMTRDQIFRLILGQTLTSSSGTTGSLALGEVHERVAWNKTFSDSIMVGKTIQAIVKTLYELNGFTGGIPEFSFESPKGIQKELADRDLVLNSLGVRFSTEYFVDEYDLDEEQVSYEAPPIIAPSSQPFTAKLSAQKKRFISSETFQARIGEAEKLEKKYIDESINYGKEIEDIVKSGTSQDDIKAKLKAFIRKGTKDFDENLTDAMLNASIAGVKDADV